MNPYSPRAVAELLRAHDLHPHKRLGQNFLWDRNVLERIVRVARVTPDEPVLEIGAGLGSLTRVLADHARTVTSVEVDRGLQQVLDELAAECPNVAMVYGDVLALDWGALADRAFGDGPGAVVANIPYSITTPLVERLLRIRHRLRCAVLLVQLEVAARLAACPGTKDYGSLSVFVQYHMRVETAMNVSRTVFVPQPDVASAVVILTPVLPAAIEVRCEGTLFRVVRAGFGQRRKTLANALSAAPEFDRASVEAALDACGIAGSRRAETLSLSEFGALADALVDVAERGDP